MYLTVIFWSLLILLLIDSSTVEPDIATAVTALSLPSVVTEKAEAAAVVEERVSL